LTHNFLARPKSRCTLELNPRAEIGAMQFTVAIHEGTPFQMEWRLPEMREIERCRIDPVDLYIKPGDRPIFQRWTCAPRIPVIAMEQTFIEQIVGEAFDRRELELRTQIGIRDPVIDSMASVWRQLQEGRIMT
jgi:AraC family transcriptional regulator